MSVHLVSGNPIHLTRRIEADPTSAALLLAGRTAMDLWPGLQRVGPEGRGSRVQAQLHDPAGHPAAVTVRALPPRRSDTTFLSTFEWTSPSLPATHAELRLAAVPGSAGLRTHAVLVLRSEDLPCSPVSRADLQRMAEGFLTNLAQAAEQRRFAA